MPYLSRLTAAIECLKEGQHFRFGDFLLYLKDTNTVIVMGWTRFAHLENLTKGLATNELTDVKQGFSQMALASNELTEFINEKTLVYALGYDTGKASVEICHEKAGQIVWRIDLKE